MARWLSGKEPACQWRGHKTRVWSLGQEDPLEKGMATHSNIHAWGIPWTEEPGRLYSIRLKRVGQVWRTLARQCRRRRRCGFDPWVRKIPWRRKRQPTPVFLLGNPMDRCAWRVPVHGVAKSQTWLSNWAHMQSHRREGLGIGGGRVNKHKSLHLLLLRGRHSINISIFISTNLPG